MADNITLPASAGLVLATDEVGGAHYAVNKLAFGPLNTATLVTAAVGLPTSIVGTPTVAVSGTPTVAVSGTPSVMQSGTWTVQPGNTANSTPWNVALAPTTAGGLSIAKLAAAATTNATLVKASAGQVYGYSLWNNSAYTVYLKLYATTVAPTVGTTTPALVIAVPAGGGREMSLPQGLAMAGISYAITKGIADTDATAVAAFDLVGGIYYK